MRDKLKKQKPKQKKSEAITFLTTFIAAFLIVMVVGTPIFAQVNKVLDLTPGGGGGPVLEEQVDFAELIPSDSPFFDAFTNTNRINILFLGVNHGEGLTDTIMLGSFDIDNKFIDIIWIPRDTYYYRGPGYIDRAHHKINAVWRRDAVNSAVAVSEVLMNIPIHNYVELSFEGVAKIIDEMGGVPMDIQRDMVYSDPYDKPPLHINIKKGPQVLDGKTSVEFLRYRYGYADADLGRIKAQQEFMKSAVKQSLSLDLPKIARVAFENIQSDITLRQAIYLATKAIGIRSEDVRMHQMPIRSVDYFVRPDVQGIADMLAEIYSMEPVVVEDDGEEED